MVEDSYYQTRMTLLEKLRDKHDDGAWADFAYYYRGYIYNIVRRMNLDHHDAEEVVQLVLIKSWDKLPDFEYDPNKGRFRGWLCRITGNAVKNYFRDVKNRFVELNEETAPPDMQQISLPDIERIAEEEWEEYIPKLAWKNIEKNFDTNVRRTFTMFTEGKVAKEIAEELGIAESSVYVYKKRIQDKLRPEIKRLRNELG